ncbi:hypothetical protein G9A89_016586 [Geosiphon pyriformis]|nr:hypothetical protein G9A89_016586 [Geosiphon pyriformis]
MANNPMQTNILAALQGIQTVLGRRNNTPLLLFRNNAQDLKELSQPTSMIKNTSFKSLVAISKALLLPGSHKKQMPMLNTK